MDRWSQDQANTWYKKQPWLVGCNFIPSNAINQLEMWQENTFDKKTNQRELGWAASIGMNSVRVYLHDLAWESDVEGLKKRINSFLKIAEYHNIRPAFVLFDDCWNEDPKIGKQPDPIPGVHNSGWLQSPGKKVVNTPNLWSRLEYYVKSIIGAFAADERIAFWDLYNEPGGSDQGIKSLPLLKKVFEWAREIKPIQPLTSGIWRNIKPIVTFQLQQSDILTFHNYFDHENLKKQITQLKANVRPIICTEWLRRGYSNVATHLPIFKREKVGCYNWGLVSGKTQTIYPWGSKKHSPSPTLWFHDLLKKDGTAFDQQEIKLFKKLTSV